MEYYQFLFQSISTDQKDILTALLSDTGFTGFEEEDESFKAFISKDAFEEAVFNNTIAALDLTYQRSEIQETNWNAQWEASFEPVSVLYPGTNDRFVHVRAGFHKADEQAVYDIVVTPKMSFGTGHHATTYLMIEQMSQLNFINKKVIDFGTGTGVLAIVAEKLGAESIIAIDNDDWSINNAQENIATNHCKKITLVKAETISDVEKSGIILANINLNIIVSNLQAIKNACETGGTILFSGIMKHDEPLILKALEESNIEITRVLERAGWIAVLAKCIDV